MSRLKSNDLFFISSFINNVFYHKLLFDFRFIRDIKVVTDFWRRASSYDIVRSLESLLMCHGTKGRGCKEEKEKFWH